MTGDDPVISRPDASLLPPLLPEDTPRLLSGPPWAMVVAWATVPKQKGYQMDRRIINTGYAVAPIQLFVKLANLCLSVTADQGVPNPPFIAPGRKDLIGQVFGEEPFTGGVLTYWQIAEDGESVNMWDTDQQEDAPECPPFHTFKLAEMDSFIAKWLVGEV